MNENIDLTEILNGCPIGTKFYHVMYGTVRFVCLDLDSDYPIRLSVHDDNDNIPNTTLTARGTWSEDFDGECLLFPSKEQRDWNRFERFWDKPKRFDPKTMQPYDTVLARDSEDSVWISLHLWNHPNEDFELYCCSGYFFAYCIPYNDETKHLIGTADDCPDYYKWWEN